MGVPHFNHIFHYKPTIWQIFHLWNPPMYLDVFLISDCNLRQVISLLCDNLARGDLFTKALVSAVWATSAWGFGLGSWEGDGDQGPDESGRNRRRDGTGPVRSYLGMGQNVSRMICGFVWVKAANNIYGILWDHIYVSRCLVLTI